jgi:hypothetical protein
MTAESRVTRDAVQAAAPEAFGEMFLVAAPAGIDDLDFHVLNIPPRSGR